MKKQISVILAAAVGLVAFTGAAVAQGNGSVVVNRGAEAQTVHFDNHGGVVVVRGQPAAKPVAPTHKAAHPSVRRLVAGNTLWIINAKTKRLVACQLRTTTQVGGRKIRCRSRRLPAALR